MVLTQDRANHNSGVYLKEIAGKRKLWTHSPEFSLPQSFAVFGSFRLHKCLLNLFQVPRGGQDDTLPGLFVPPGATLAPAAELDERAG
jgi:hypothetical protein